MFNPIPYGKHNITEDDIRSVVDVLKSENLTQGPKIREFENAFADYVGSEFALAVTNGTAALHLSALALDIKPGDKVITTPITFAATANCIKLCGGEVVFADINPETYLIDSIAVERLLKSSPKGTYKGIIPVDFAGRPVDLESLRKMAGQNDLWILEDACHAPGGYFLDSSNQQQKCGNGVFADSSIFSFHPVKHIACGEGGMITTNRKDLYDNILRLRSHGITKNPDAFQNTSMFIDADNHSASLSFPKWYYEMQDLGYNYRITDIQAALGISQLKRAEMAIESRIAIAKKYSEAFDNSPYILRHSRLLTGHAYHLYVIEVEDRNGLYNYLRQKNIFCQVHYIPIHLMPYYKQYGSNGSNLPNAEKYFKQCLSLPMYPTLADSEQSYVIETILSYYSS